MSNQQIFEKQSVRIKNIITILLVLSLGFFASYFFVEKSSKFAVIFVGCMMLFIAVVSFCVHKYIYRKGGDPIARHRKFSKVAMPIIIISLLAVIVSDIIDLISHPSCQSYSVLDALNIVWWPMILGMLIYPYLSKKSRPKG